MNKYLRLGEIPESGRSINFLKLTFEQNEDFTHDLDCGNVKQAFSSIPEYAYEDGLSVFDMDNDGMPVLSNLQLVSSLLARINEVAYIVTGEEIKKGNDGEPLIKLEKNDGVKDIDKDMLIEYVLSVLKHNFSDKSYKSEDDHGSNKLFHFFAEYKVNKKTGEKLSRWAKTKGKDWEILPGVDEYTFNGWTFSNPVDGFDAKLGM
ncbi:MAG: hypothetical protein ACI4DU_01400 [Lachnospiraceae bacterium]